VPVYGCYQLMPVIEVYGIPNSEKEFTFNAHLQINDYSYTI